MKRIMIAILLLCGMIQKTVAQESTIKGLIKDAGTKEVIAFANVVLEKTDSTFIAGVTTNEKGQFSLEKVKAGDYRMIVSSLGYEPEYIALNGFSKAVTLDEILLRDAAISLGEVTISASNQSSRSDRKLVFPSERQVKASANGVDLLQQLMLPKIQVNALSNEIKVPGNGEVQLRINGVKAEMTEIKALIPSDIVRIEYHDNPGLRYGNAEVVLDYIVRRPDTGGSVSLDMRQGVTAMWGEHNIAAKINHKKSEFGASYRVGPRNFYGMYRDNEERFELADGSILHRREEGEPDRARILMQNLNVNYSNQDPEKYLFNATLRYSSTNRPRWNYHGVLSNIEKPTDQVSMIDRTNDHWQTPALDLYYQRNLKHDQTLVFNVVGTYNTTTSHRIYQESSENELLTDVDNQADGNKYSVIGEAIYEKKLKNGNRLSGGLRHNQSFSNNEYLNGHFYQTRMNQAESFLYAEFKAKVSKLDYTLSAGVTRSYYKQKGTGDSYQYYTFNPRIILHYNLPGQSFIRLKSDIGNSAPSLANLSAIDQIIDSLQIQRGNPNLKSYQRYRTELTYEFQKNIFYANIWGTYEYQPNAIMDEKFQEGNKIIQTWDNQKDWQRLAGTTTFRVGPIKEILQLSFTGGVNHYISHGNTYSHTYTNWFCDVQASVNWKKFSLLYGMNTNWNWFWGETMDGGENIQMLMVNYRHKNLTVGVGAINPFTDDYKQQSANWNKYASYEKSNFFKESSRLFLVSLSYNFSFGRTFSVGQKRLNNSDNESGVMSTGK